MKKILFAICTALVAVSCASTQAPEQQPLENSVVYEMNVRQYTPEGTFAAAQQELPRLKVQSTHLIPVIGIFLGVL